MVLKVTQEVLGFIHSQSETPNQTDQFSVIRIVAGVPRRHGIRASNLVLTEPRNEQMECFFDHLDHRGDDGGEALALFLHHLLLFLSDLQLVLLCRVLQLLLVHLLFVLHLDGHTLRNLFRALSLA